MGFRVQGLAFIGHKVHESGEKGFGLSGSGLGTKLIGAEGSLCLRNTAILESERKEGRSTELGHAQPYTPNPAMLQTLTRNPKPPKP